MQTHNGTPQTSGPTLVPIYQYHALLPEGGWKYFYSTNSQVGYGWTLDGIGFYASGASEEPFPGMIPIYQFHRIAKDGAWLNYYSRYPNPYPGWTPDGNVFCAFPPEGQNGFNAVYVYQYSAEQADGDGYRYAYSTSQTLGSGWTLTGPVFQAYLNPIQHIFVVMLENHSFDNMFAMSNIPGIIAATTSNSNTYNGATYNVHSNAPASMPTDPGHEFLDVVEQLAGPGAVYPAGRPYPTANNSGFAANYATSITEGPAGTIADSRHHGRLCDPNRFAHHVRISN